MENQFIDICRSGKLEEAKKLLEDNPSIYISAQNEEAFRDACWNGHLEVAKWLLNAKPTIDISAENEYAFRNACADGHLEVAKWLLEVKPTIDIFAENDDAFRRACEIDFHKKLVNTNISYHRSQNSNQSVMLKLEKRLLEFKVTTNMSDEDYEEFRMSCKPDKKLFIRDYELDKLEVAKWLQSLYPEKYYVKSIYNKVVSYKIIKKQGKNQ